MICCWLLVSLCMLMGEFGVYLGFYFSFLFLDKSFCIWVGSFCFMSC